MMQVALAFGLIIFMIHFLSEKIHVRHVTNIVSFSAGIFITYLFLELFPQLYMTDYGLNRIAMLFVLVGFSFFHLLEKYIYKHKKTRKQLQKELKEVHSISFFVYHFVLGLVLFKILQAELFAGLLFFMPVALHTATSSISMRGIHSVIRKQLSIKVLLSASTLIGISFFYLIPVTELLYYVLLGFVVGAILHSAIFDSIPRERKGEPLYFLVGVMLYALIITIFWII